MNKITTNLPIETLVKSHLGIAMLGVMDAQSWCEVEENAKLVAAPDMMFEKFGGIVDQVLSEKRDEASRVFYAHRAQLLEKQLDSGMIEDLYKGPQQFPNTIYEMQFVNYMSLWFQDLMARAIAAQMKGRIHLIDPGSNGGFPPVDPFHRG